MTNLTKILAGLALCLTIANAQCEDGLIAHYPFDNNANDASGNGNHGVVSNAVLSADRFGTPNSAYQFNGTSAAVVVSDNTALQSLTSNYTFLVWAKFASLPNRDISLLFKSISAGVQYNKWILWKHINPPIGIGLLTGANPISQWNVNFSFVTNRWYFIGFSAKGTNASISVDGVTLSVQAGNTTLNTTLGASLSIGGAEPGGSQWFHGDIDDVRIYDRGLSSSEIAQIHGNVFSPTLNVRKAIYLDSGILEVGTNYQVQVSSNLSSWTNYGAAFTATNFYWRSDYFDVDNWNRLFFRLQTVP